VNGLPVPTRELELSKRPVQLMGRHPSGGQATWWKVCASTSCVGAPDASLTQAAGMPAVGKLVDRLEVERALDEGFRPINRETVACPVRLATANLVGVQVRPDAAGWASRPDTVRGRLATADSARNTRPRSVQLVAVTTVGSAGLEK